MQELAENLLELANTLTEDLHNQPKRRGRKSNATKQTQAVITSLRETAHELLVLNDLTDQYS